ncbi:MAG TPA: hypothetical protein VF275_01450 [Gammaproteobacteria bacterium]
MNTHMNTAIALLKRETWEHRSFWIVPTAFAAIIAFGFATTLFFEIPTSIGIDRAVEKIARNMSAGDLDRAGIALLPMLAFTFFLVMTFIGVFYLLDALYAERRDRSILFWKSLPVTDTATVLSKWCALFFVLPIIVLTIVLTLYFVLAFFATIFVLIGGGNAWTIVISNLSLSGLGDTLIALYVEMLWYAPLFGWLLLASAWAKKAPFLWAVLPPVAIAILEKMFLDTDNFLDVVGSRLALFGGSQGFDELIGHEFSMFGAHGDFSGEIGFDISFFGDLFTAAGFWYGLVFAAACTAGAIWLRRYRDES